MEDKVLARKKLRGGLWVVWISMTALALVVSMIPSRPAHAQAAWNKDQWYAEASQEFGVPKELLKAVAYNQSRWRSHHGEPSMDGGYGPMDLTTDIPKDDDHGSGKPQPKNRPDAKAHTLDEAANLIRVSADELKKNERQNIRGAAAVLRERAQRLRGGGTPQNLAEWKDAVAEFSAAASSDGAQKFADQVYDTLNNGASANLEDGSEMKLEPTKVDTPKSPDLQSLAQPEAPLPKHMEDGGNLAQCPTDLTCKFTPAAYTQNSTDPSDYGNYDKANRPDDMKIRYIVIHDTEGSYQSAINHFQNPASYVSCNYVIRSSDGEVTQMVRNEDIPWCAGDWYVNMHSINIEHEGFAADGATWYTEAMYQSSAKLVRYLAEKYNIPLDREHIIGHDEVPTVKASGMPGQHWDPGPFWDWNHYMALTHGVSDEKEMKKEARPRGSQEVVTILPTFATNKPTFLNCLEDGTCTPQTQSSNAVLLHTQPNEASPLLSDPYLHPDTSPGTNKLPDWGSRAVTGQRYVVAGQTGDWTGIYYSGQTAWFYNPGGSVARKSRSSTITPKTGQTSIPVYGTAYPSADRYPSQVPVQQLEKLYDMPAGQTYAIAIRKTIPNDYYYAYTIDSSLPEDHTVIKGHEKFYQVMFNKRIMYVRADDVDLNR